MKQNFKAAKTRDSRRFVIIITESGSMYMEQMDAGIMPMAKKLLGSNEIDTIPCGMDRRFTLAYAANASMDRCNRTASQLAQEYIMGPVMVIRGEKRAEFRGLALKGAKKAMEDLAALAGGGYGDV